MPQIDRLRTKHAHKSIILGLLSAILLTQLLGCAAARPDFSELVSERDEVRTYEVFGMDCPGCHGGLENLVNKIPGVKASRANWEKQRLRVIIKPGAEVTDEAIYEAIKLANFASGQRLK